MVDERAQSGRAGRPRALLAVAVFSFAGLLVLGVVTYLEIDLGLSLTVSPHRVTPGTAVAAVLLVAGAIALPAAILAGWQTTREAATRERRQ
ncbi:hypothetical protein RBH26_08445 [Natronolimnohabitans sp. A-GB9]|uniref:hypothetical protein n=1 Tax=Natronolimnohabitans sp. A-GB9 TaxID=3069757 RepID=UPI0027B6065B|nr:hypothetical protein [Natronolimnohabitans sp. A-GB9]MDQ2050515.1 hypothetical protein [Natronolimnohabitans sp. A-GB9]